MKIQTNTINYNSVLHFPLRSNGVGVSFSSGTETSDLYINIKNQQQKEREQAKQQRFIAFVSAIGVTISGAVGIIASFLLPEKPDSSDFETPPASIGAPFDNESDEPLGILTEGNTQATETETTIDDTIPPTTVVETIPETTVLDTEETTPETTIYETEPEIEETIEIDEISTEDNLKNQVDVIFAENPDVEIQYNRIVESLETFSTHLGEDGLSYLLGRINEIAPNGEVAPIDVLKIMHIESTGRIYNKYGELIKSESGAYGPFQVKQSTADTLNEHYGLSGKDKLNVKYVYSSIDAAIYNIKFINEKRAKDIENGVKLPTGTDLKTTMAWSYHDGPWATSVSYWGQDYIQKYSELSILDEHPEVIDYILTGAE